MYNLSLTICSIGFLIVLMMVYFSKPKEKTSRSLMFTLLLYIGLATGIAQIIHVALLEFTKLEIISHIFWRLHCGTYLLWWFCYYIYITVVIRRIKSEKLIDTFKSTTQSKVITILSLIGFVAFLVFPRMKGLDGYLATTEGLNFMPTIIMYACVIVFVIIFILMALNLIMNRNSVTKNEKISFVLTAIITAMCIAGQIFIPHIALLPIGAVMVLYFIYYALENPDLEMIEGLDNAKGDIEKSNKTKTDFLSNMTTEIKSPMSLIMSLCDELTNMSQFDEKVVREDIQQIRTSGNNLLDIVNNILDISKIESGRTILQERDYKINDVITDVINISKSKIGAKQVKLVVNIDQNTSAVLHGDSAKLYQALLNVTTNAVKFTDVGRITITLTSTKSLGIEHLLFKVTDTGTGIKPEDQGKIFQKFNRLDNATEGEIEGSGLGLAITKQYVELLGGKIWFDSQYRVGTTFYIDVPQKIVDSTPIGQALQAAANAQEVEKLDCSAYTALIVDDNLLNIKVAKRLLEAYKFNVDSVTSGKDCVYKVKEGTHFDVIFMDHMMPEMDGIETLHVLKQLDGYKLPPIVALTANAIAGMKEMYLSEGFDEYLSKPINTHELDRIVNKFFQK